jgi:hypothetical protein
MPQFVPGQPIEAETQVVETRDIVDDGIGCAYSLYCHSHGISGGQRRTEYQFARQVGHEAEIAVAHQTECSSNFQLLENFADGS